MLYSGADELVHSQTSIGMDRAFKATSGLYWYYHPAAEHLTYIALDDWRKEAADTAHLLLVTTPRASPTYATPSSTAWRTASGTTAPAGSRRSQTVVRVTEPSISPTTGAG